MQKSRSYADLTSAQDKDVDGQESILASVESQREEPLRICVCTDEDLSCGARFFDFDLRLVERAFHKDKQAFEQLCERLCVKLDQIERKIVQLCPGWPSEHVERVRDLFVHDRFLKILMNPPDIKIENFNALCWKFLHDSIVDAWRFYRCPKRDFQIEVSSDVTESEVTTSFWDLHAAEIVGSVHPSCDSIEVSDLMRYVGRCLGAMSAKKKRVVKLWMQGYSEREISSLTGMAVGSVGSIVSRTISELRRKLCKNVR